MGVHKSVHWSNVCLVQLELEYSDDLNAIRQIKFPILCEYDAKPSKMKILAFSEDLSQLWWYTFSQKWEKCKTWVLEHHIKMDDVQNVRKNPAKPKLVLKIFYIILHAHF